LLSSFRCPQFRPLFQASASKELQATELCTKSCHDGVGASALAPACPLLRTQTACRSLQHCEPRCSEEDYVVGGAAEAARSICTPQIMGRPRQRLYGIASQRGHSYFCHPNYGGLLISLRCSVVHVLHTPLCYHMKSALELVPMATLPRELAV
jgi:hypothetical protein